MAYFFSPIGNSQIVDANGDPLVGGTISTYLAGTSTAETTYTDDTGGTQQGVVMTLNSLGLPTNGPVWMLGGVPLKFIIKNAAGVTQSTFDDVSGIGDTATTADQWILYGAAPTYISATSFSVVGDQTNAFHVGRRTKTVNSGGTVYSSITASAFAAGVTTVTVVNDSGVLDSDLSAVSYGLLTATNPSVPSTYAKSGANSDITSLTALTSAPALTALPGQTQFRALPITQCVLSGPVDSNGLPAFGGSVGTATLTTSGTIKIAAAAGGDLSYVGSIVNAAFTSPAGNGTAYLMLSVTAAGVVTAGVRALLPVMQFGGTYSTTSGQMTHNIQEGTTKVGNGATADVVYEVCVGECAHTAGVWSGTITWRAVKDQYYGAWTATLPAAGAPISANHNIGHTFIDCAMEIECTTANVNYAVGDIVEFVAQNSSGPVSIWRTRNATGFTVQSAGLFALADKSTGSFSVLTNTSWKYRMKAQKSVR